MALTEDESRRLGAIESELARLDPRLNRSLAAGRPRRAGLTRVGAGAGGASAVGLTFGVIAQQPAVCVAGWIGLLGGAALVWVHRLGPGQPPTPCRHR